MKEQVGRRRSLSPGIVQENLGVETHKLGSSELRVQLLSLNWLDVLVPRRVKAFGTRKSARVFLQALVDGATTLQPLRTLVTVPEVTHAAHSFCGKQVGPRWLLLLSTVAL